MSQNSDIYGETYWGFVYIWYDKRKQMFYIGSHFGAVDDGYVGSSRGLRNAYSRRSSDFRRKVIEFLRENSYDELMKL